MLKEITKDNLLKNCYLTTNEDGVITINEKFVASNVVSIAQSKYEENTITKAVYDDDTPIGFIMYGMDERGECWIIRFMIDYRFQGKGYGRKTFALMLEDVLKTFNPSEVKLSIEPNNDKAKALYESFGFIDTGTIEDDEKVFLYKAK